MSSEEETLSPDEIEDEVFNTLLTLDVSELREIYSLLELECKEELEGKKSKLLKYLLYLCTCVMWNLWRMVGCQISY